MCAEVVIRLEEVRHSLGGRPVLDGVNVAVSAGQSMAVTGPSGSGKTTLLMCAAGLLVPDEGSVHIGDVDISRLRAGARAAARLRSVGVVYQFGELLPELSPFENVALPALLAGMSRARAYERARSLLADLEVEGLADTATAVLSGGERQRVAVARALVTEPVLLLADEPTGSLDRDSTEVVARLLYELPDRRGCAVIVVTHNAQVAMGADVQMELVNGKLVEAAR